MTSELEFTLEAQPRQDVGKGASRRLRREKRVPAVVYGGDSDAMALTLSHDEVFRKLQFEAFFSHILTLRIDGQGEQQAILRDLQRHPFKPHITHIDFLRVQADREIQVRVPLHFLNEEEAVGVRMGGGEISHLESEVNISCLPRYLPEYIEVDLGHLDVGDTVHLSELVLPAGVVLVDLAHGEEYDYAVASCHMPRVTAEEDLVVEEAEGEAEPEAAAEGEEAEAEEPGEASAGEEDSGSGDDADAGDTRE